MVVLTDSRADGSGKLMSFDLGECAQGVAIGDSIALNGCCLTVVAIDGNCCSFELGEETLSKTTLGRLSVGDRVNCERSLRVGDRMGGHFVTGHVDGPGVLRERRDDGQWSYFYFTADIALLKQMASKGSICIDGVSLTVVDATDAYFSIALIPHTLSVTTLGSLQTGDVVNLETDILAKYIARNMAT